LIERFSPPSILVNSAHDIVHLSASAGRFLQFTGGEPTRNLLRNVHPMLRVDLRAALYAAAQTANVATVSRVPIEVGDTHCLVGIRVTPAGDIAPNFLLVVFEEHPAGDATAVGVLRNADADQAALHLERELVATKAQLRETIEESEAATEELKASNEELQAMNEELRSATEELETSREELQSINEELGIVNDELKSNVEQLARSNSDLQNLMAATDIATVFLDRELRILRCTPSAKALFNLTSTDLGQPLSDLGHQLDCPELVVDAERSLAHLLPAQREVSAGEQWYIARTLPYRTVDDHIAGVVLTFLDITERKRAEKEIARLAADSDRQRRVYETVLTNTPDFVYVFSLDHRVLYANESLIKMWGRGREGAIGKTFLEIGYEPWHAEMHSREIDQVRATRQPIRGEVPFNGTHGRRQYEYIFVPVIGANGEVEAVAGTTRDVTERRQAEERQAFQIRLADTLRALVDPLKVQAEASRMLGEHLGANRVVYFEIRGDEYVIEREYTAGVRPLAGRYPVAAFGPALLAELLEGRTVVESDATTEPHRPPEEQASFAGIHVKGHVDVPLVKGGRFVAGMTVHVSDVRDWTMQEVALIQDTAEWTWAAVERVRAEAALQQSEERLAFVRRSSGVGFWYCDLPFDVLQWDDLVKEHFHLPPEAVVTIQTFYDRLHPDDRAPTRQAIEQSIAARTPYDVHYRTTHPDTGAVKWVRAIGRTFYAADGNPIRFDGVTLDVSEQKQAEAELKEADRRKDEFLATLAHELRNPLAPIRTGLELIRMVGPLDQLAEVQSMMERQLLQMTRLVDDLLDVSRLTTGKFALRKERLELGDVISAALETSLPVIEQQGHALNVVVPDEPIFVDGDRVRLAQVVSNLLINSAKYTHRGGTIRLSAARDDEAAVLAVTDDGIGIPTDMLDAVFGMFTQVDRTLEKANGGLGVGLSLVKGLVEMHGGSIQARSEGEGRGSEFAVRLPVAPAPADPALLPDAPVKNAEPDGRCRILLIDDNVDAADSLGQILELMDHEVRTAYDGASGIEAARAFRPDIVLCDIGMPKMNGYDTARTLRSEAWGKDTVLVALTGWSHEEDRRKSAEAGFDHHLVKPVEVDALVSLLGDARARQA
jgi:PAS domain S-box-containing protein